MVFGVIAGMAGVSPLRPAWGRRASAIPGAPVPGTAGLAVV